MIHQTIFVALATLAVSSAFVAPSRMPTARAARLNMVLEAGASAPLGLWDPLGFTKADPLTVKKYREAEIKHGRVSMLAAIGNIVHEGAERRCLLCERMFPSINNALYSVQAPVRWRR
jgi:hypothetical protein